MCLTQLITKAAGKVGRAPISVNLSLCSHNILGMALLKPPSHRAFLTKNVLKLAPMGRAPWPARDALVTLLEAGRKPQCASRTKRCQTVPT